jgi:hypothetical protein
MKRFCNSALLGIIVACATVVLFSPQIQATVFSGNGSTDWGGSIGNGSLTLTDNGTTISGSLVSPADIGSWNALVIYIQSPSSASGFSDTSGFTDDADGNRSSIAGLSGGNRGTLDFAPGFTPNYAISLVPNGANYGGIWQLANGASFPWVDGVNLSPTGVGGPQTYTFSFPVTDIGLTASSGQTVNFFGTLLGTSGYRSSEAIGGNISGSDGWNTMTESGFSSYTIIPEPSSISLVVVGLLGAIGLIRRRKA